LREPVSFVDRRATMASLYGGSYLMSAPIRAARSLGRWLVFSIAFISSASGVWLLARTSIDAAQIGEVGTSFALHENAVTFRNQFADVHAKQHVALLGDSTMLAAPGMNAPHKQALPERIAAALHKYGEHGEQIEISALRVPGLGPAAMYLISQEIVDARPDRVVLALNLRSFSNDAFRTFSYAESAGWLPPSQLFEALSLPLFHGGLTADRLLFYRALVTCGAERTWPEVRELQGRAFKLREWLATRTDSVLGTRGNEDMQFGLGIARWVRVTTEVEKVPRQSKAAAERSLRSLFRGLSPQNPGLQILSAVVARFRRANIPVLVYATPVNVEHLGNLGLPMRELDRSVQTIARVVRKQGGEFVDFHAVLPLRAFRDPGDHFTFDGQPNGTFRLASYVAAALVKSVPAEPAKYVVQ
jgi:hypothetical protein